MPSARLRGGPPIRLRCASFSGCVAGGAARLFDDLPDAALDRSGDARGGLHLAAAATGRCRFGQGKTVSIDATTLEANAALRSIVRRDTGESYQDFLTKLAQASSIETSDGDS